MSKRKITEQEKLSLLEEIRKELENLRESLSDEDFRSASEKMIKNWGGAIEKEKSAKLSPEDMFDMIDAGAAARADIESEFGEEEFMPMSDDEYRNLMGDIDEAVDERGLFQVEDADGNIIKRHALVVPTNGVDKKGRVMGFGDDGQGRMQLLVTWEWPIEMRHTNPEEMGKDRVYPEDIVLASSTSNIGNEQPIEEMRGVGHGVKNSGDRNIKLRDDHHMAPITNLDESIKTLSEGKVTKRGLLEFIKDEAKKISKNI